MFLCESVFYDDFFFFHNVARQRLLRYCLLLSVRIAFWSWTVWRGEHKSALPGTRPDVITHLLTDLPTKSVLTNFPPHACPSGCQATYKGALGDKCDIFVPFCGGPGYVLCVL